MNFKVLNYATLLHNNFSSPEVRLTFTMLSYYLIVVKDSSKIHEVLLVVNHF